MSINPQIFREYDIRGISGRDLDEDVYETIGKATAQYIQSVRKYNRMCIGRDGRLTSEDYSNALIRGLAACGIDVIDIGQVPTPVLYYGLFNLEVDGGFMVTASHNPKEYNGLKVAVGNSTIHGEQIQEIRKIAEAGVFPKAGRPGLVVERNLVPAYMDQIAGTVNLKRKLRVVLDSGNGVGGPVAVPLYERLGCEVIPLFCEVDGTFPNHHPDPTIPENLQTLIQTVLDQKADVGIALDGDVDRLGTVDETGQIIWGDKLLILFARSILKEKPGATVIGEVKCSRTLFDDVAKHGGNPVMWKTGHSLIKAAMKDFGAEVAGEMSGHMFFKHRWYGFDDAIYAGARLLEFMAQSDMTLHEHLASVPEMHITPEMRIATSDARKFAIVDEALHHFRDELKLNVNAIDGLRIEWPDGWGLLRASNTSPVLVMRCEAATPQRLDEIKNLLESEVNKLNT